MRVLGLCKAALVGACATAATVVRADLHHDAAGSVALKDLSIADVKVLVSSWGLDNLASHLSADEVDGETLFHAELGDFDGLGDAATAAVDGGGSRPSPIRNHHWKKFWRRLSEIRDDGGAVVDTSIFAKATPDLSSSPPLSSSSFGAAGSPARHRRQLASSSSDVPSGILLRGEKTRVSFGAAGDAFLEYNSTGTIGIKADALNVHGTLMVGGEECLCAAPPAACPVGGATVSAGATAEKIIDTTFWKDMDMTVSVETYSDDDRVLLLCNVNYNPEGDSYWGEVTIFRGSHDLGPLQRMDALNEHNQPANMLFMDHPGMTGTVTYSARGRYVGGVFSVSQGSLERHCIAIRAGKGYAERSLALGDLLQVSSTSYVDTGLEVEITTESDDEGVLIAANMNYDSDSTGNWGYFTILRDDVETGPWQVRVCGVRVRARVRHCYGNVCNLEGAALDRPTVCASVAHPLLTRVANVLCGLGNRWHCQRQCHC